MKKLLLIAKIFTLTLLLSSCEYQETTSDVSKHEHTFDIASKVYNGFPETIETGTKTSYSTADVALATGSWNFNDALIGTLSTDRKNGSKSARIQNSGMLTMNFDLTNGVNSFSVLHAKFGTDANSSFTVWYSTNSGASWTQTGSTVNVTSTTLTQATFNLTISGQVRFQIRKGSGGRLNLDDITIEDYNTIPDDTHLTMGNPSNAVTDIAFPNNYLVEKLQYVYAYNNSRGSCSWVSWHLQASHMGSTPRCDCFAQDTQLPSSFYRASSTAYTGSGFDRGHQCPSAERNDNATNNAATFLMSNMLPQAPNLNQITWNALEDYERTLVAQGNELYIISGGYGSGGTGSAGGVTYTINNGKITVPSRCWKIIVVLPHGSNDISRVTTSTRVIAVDMPNTQTVNSQPWGNYRVTVDSIEAATGYDFLSNVPASIQAIIENTVDNGLSS